MIMKKCVINTKTDSIIVFIAPNGCIGLVTIGIPRILMDKVLSITNFPLLQATMISIQFFVIRMSDTLININLIHIPMF